MNFFEIEVDFFNTQSCVPESNGKTQRNSAPRSFLELLLSRCPFRIDRADEGIRADGKQRPTGNAALTFSMFVVVASATPREPQRPDQRIPSLQQALPVAPSLVEVYALGGFFRLSALWLPSPRVGWILPCLIKPIKLSPLSTQLPALLVLPSAA